MIKDTEAVCITFVLKWTEGGKAITANRTSFLPGVPRIGDSVCFDVAPNVVVTGICWFPEDDPEDSAVHVELQGNNRLVGKRGLIGGWDVIEADE